MLSFAQHVIGCSLLMSHSHIFKSSIVINLLSLKPQLREEVENQHRGSNNT